MSTPDYPDGAHTAFTTDLGPLVTVRFPDGGQADFLAGSWHPGSARIRYEGLELKGLRVNVDAGVDPGGRVWSLWLWKTGVAGIDGGNVVPAEVQAAAESLCRQRAREARAALRAAASGRPGPGASGAGGMRHLGEPRDTGRRRHDERPWQEHDLRAGGRGCRRHRGRAVVTGRPDGRLPAGQDRPRRPAAGPLHLAARRRDLG